MRVLAYLRGCVFAYLRTCPIGCLGICVCAYLRFAYLGGCVFKVFAHLHICVFAPPCIVVFAYVRIGVFASLRIQACGGEQRTMRSARNAGTTSGVPTKDHPNASQDLRNLIAHRKVPRNNYCFFIATTLSLALFLLLPLSLLLP